MQTFLPYESYHESALVLDDRRLGKQRVECKQILIALGVPIGVHAPNPLSAWRHHPATLMWRGYEYSLLKYSLAICAEWRIREFQDTLWPQFKLAIKSVPDTGRPAWLGDQRLHLSHKSNLLRKYPVYYKQFHWSVSDDLAYFWPVQRKGEACAAQ